MFSSKLEEIRKSFSSCRVLEEVYKEIIAWGKKLPPFDPSWKTEKNLVPGCQSLLYLYADHDAGKVFFSASSDALISAGLAALLVYFYSGETPETILKTPPTFLEEFNIPASLTPGRANGLASLYLRMKQEALQALLTNK